MRRLKFFIVAALLSYALCVFVPTAKITKAETGDYYIGGMTVGFLLSAGGAKVIELTDISSEDGICHPASDAGIKAGDCICAVNDKQIKNIQDLNEALNKCGGKQVTLTVKRNGESAQVTLTPVKDKKSGNYKIGVLIRDTLSGVGTVSYIERESGKFAALGHGVTDEENQALEISDKRVYPCSIIGITKGQRGKAGELRGLFLNEKPLATAEFVCKTGLYGTFSKDYDYSRLELIDIAPLSEATIGKAVIYSTINGCYPQQYEIAIAKVDDNNRENKNFVVKVTDETLLNETGGIVQGMSGSPIIQNGKLIGAITHVFLNDPTRGYGIGIENMMQK